MDRLQSANKRLKTAHDERERDYKAQIEKLDAKENDLLIRLSELDKSKVQAAEINGNANAADDDVVNVNAGGKNIVAKRSTLCQIKGSRLESLFCGRWDKKLDRDNTGRVFLDVNPKCFRAIIDYLNELAISAEETPPALPTVPTEYHPILDAQMELFGLRKITHSVPSSKIIQTSNQITHILEWLNEIGSHGEFNLLYRYSRDGSSARDFHDACDNKGCTLTIIETRNGILVGGYTNAPWTSNFEYGVDDKAFLFALPGGDVLLPLKMKYNTGPALMRHPTFGSRQRGPIFGTGGTDNDLVVHGSSVYLNIGVQYESCPSHQLSSGSKFEIKEMEVFQVENNGKPSEAFHKNLAQPEKVTRFAGDINDAINNKLDSLTELEFDVVSAEDGFKEEAKFMHSFTNGDANDIVSLNVSGTMMATQRSTLLTAQDSVLAQQFDDSKWTEQGCNKLLVEEWTPDDVSSWVRTIDGVPDSIADIFTGEEITGRELLALGKEELYKIGIGRPATVALLFKEIRNLEEANSAVATLIEHSPYCFAKVLDHLRMKELCSRGLAKEPTLPVICHEQKSRFEKVVGYYFPGDSAKLLLG